MLINFWHRILEGLMNLDPGLRAPIAISLGAIPGALSRYYLTLWFTQRLGQAFPYGTFFINLSGALVMGFFTTYTLGRTIVSPELRLLVATGFLGAYTTFSTYALETHALLHHGKYGLALLYWAGSAVLGGVGCEIGSQIGNHIAKR